MNFLTGFAEIAHDYDGFILDLWGVIHNGVAPYPGAPECLARLRDAGKKIVLLTNAPRRATVIARQLERMGIEGALYDGIMSSGEATHLLLRDRPDPWYRALGDRMFYIGPDRDLGLTDGIALTKTDDPADASFILNTGPDHLRPPEEAEIFDAMLAECAAHGLPMVCANPDLEVIVDGRRVLCAGMLALRYLEMGGDARMLGKPDPAVYDPVLDMLDLPRRRVLAVGDALRTDIAGAAAAGVASCWVLGGLHGEHLGEDPAEIEAEATKVGLAPVCAIRHLIW